MQTAGGDRVWSRLAWMAAVASYLLIVLGGVVRITGSGMGCGPDWPLCNGRLIPPMDLPTLIEYSHRLVAAGVALLVGLLALRGWLGRRGEGGRRRWRLALGIAGLLVVQILLGAVTVWLELPAWSVVLHLGAAMAILALLVVAALGPEAGSAPEREGGLARMAWSLAGLAAVVVLLGALVANLGAAPACQGFPLCNGRLLPAGPWRIHLHWTHRAAAYLLVVGAVPLPWMAARRGGATGGAWLAALLAVAQLAVAAAMVLHGLPASLRAAHVALGAALFATLVGYARLETPRTGVGAENSAGGAGNPAEGGGAAVPPPRAAAAPPPRAGQGLDG